MIDYKNIKSKIIAYKPCKEGLEFLNNNKPEKWLDAAEPKFIFWLASKISPYLYFLSWKEYEENMKDTRKNYMDSESFELTQKICESLRYNQCKGIVQAWVEWIK